jgi:hypothetical protein
MTRRHLPSPRPVLWPLRSADSARHHISSYEGSVVVTIEHAALPGVTPEMLRWWYGHVPGTMTYAGQTYPRYLVWHPLDHISYDVERPAPGDGGAVAAGARLHITEAPGRDLDNLLDIRVGVEALEEGRAVIGRRVAGTAVVRLENEFSSATEGARYVSRMTIGDTTALGRLVVNQVAHRRAMPPRLVGPWMRHHIEEIGNFPNFLPDLFRERAEVEP